jgi:predicted transcriptional regulator
MTAREQITELLEKLPENFTLSDFEYHLYVIRKVEAGLRAAEEGRVISHEELEREVEEWLKK